MRRLLAILIATAVVTCLGVAVTTPRPAFGGITDKLKKKAEQKVSEKIEDKIDKTGEKAASDTTQIEGEAGQAGAEAGAAQAKGGTATAEDMTLYTKYDFVPGDKVILFDDLSGEEIGEFPSRWKLDRGVFEVVKQGGENYIMCSDEGYIRPKVAPAALPPKYTVEMEFYAKGPEAQGHWFFIQWADSSNGVLAEFSFKDNQNTALYVNGKEIASKSLPSEVASGKHTMRIMATKSTLKCYLDQERVANVPAVEGFAPVGLCVRMDPWTDQPGNPMLLRSFRLAEGGKTLKQQLDETGRIITHGILFDSGSDKIKAESYKTLADIGQLLADSPDLRLSIEGHTDSDGADDYNLNLSQKRAASVRTYLMETYKVAGERLEAKGWGEGKPIDVNTTPEGKANNRRVELVKI
jgi:outer membrane protein OmpA-like peptidoglycan-associated protein